ncbi:hypothetical protein, partial [Streptococcus agalactiae]
MNIACAVSKDVNRGTPCSIAERLMMRASWLSIDFLRNKIWYNSSMNYEASKQLTDVRFKRLVGVQRTT